MHKDNLRSMLVLGTLWEDFYFIELVTRWNGSCLL